MSHIKKLVLPLVAAAALTVFAGTASATLQSPTGTTYSSTISATAGTTYLTGTWSDVSCTHSYVSGSIFTNEANTAEGSIYTLDFSGCSDEVTVIRQGSLHLSGTTVRSNGALIVVHTSVGVCEFDTTPGYTIGTLEDSHSSGPFTARLNINNSKIPVAPGSSFFCGSTGEWEGVYEVTTPMTLYEV